MKLQKPVTEFTDAATDALSNYLDAVAAKITESGQGGFFAEESSGSWWFESGRVVVYATPFCECTDGIEVALYVESGNVQSCILDFVGFNGLLEVLS